MKKIIPVFLCITLISLLLFSFTGCNEKVIEQEIKTIQENNMEISVYNKLDEGNIVDTYAVITKYLSEEHIDHFTVPGTTSDGTKITKIAGLAFYKKDISFLTISENITVIDNFAFGYSSLNDVIFPSTLEKIGEYAFVNCIELKQLTFKSSTAPELGIYAFKYYNKNSENKDPYEVWYKLKIVVPALDNYYTTDKTSNWSDYKDNIVLNEVING